MQIFGNECWVGGGGGGGGGGSKVRMGMMKIRDREDKEGEKSLRTILKTLLVTGDKSGARRVHEIALQNNPDDAWMTYGFASFIERHDGFTDNCKKLFIRSLELAPQFG
eukprot:754452-Hanusia_phi.AAC.21